MSTCTCVRCGDCGGSGNFRVDDLGMPEWDLEPCQQCGGTGIVEVCDSCQEREEQAQDAEDSRR